MISVFQTTADLEDDAGRRAIRTGLAFALAPGIAAVVGGVVTAVVLRNGPGNFGVVVAATLVFAMVSYATALVLAAPLYLALPEAARRGAVVVPLAGAIAAAPWALVSLASQGSSLEYVATLIAFGLGCVGGGVFVLIRGGLALRLIRRR